MKKNDDTMCRIPIRATMRVIDGKAEMIDAEWADIPADAIAQYLLKAFGASVEKKPIDFLLEH